mmetsp:Transcript_45928/g.127569  ORF Transcript_45928/g.127569 Transcript_45928/m.127569 type:complete len:103 (-) Transcript_45928:1480-1788(-)
MRDLVTRSKSDLTTPWLPMYVMRNALPRTSGCSCSCPGTGFVSLTLFEGEGLNSPSDMRLESELAEDLSDSKAKDARLMLALYDVALCVFDFVPQFCTSKTA